MNPRVRYNQKYDKLVNLIDGAEFPFIPNNDASRKAALEALDAHGTRVIQAIESHAGRPLSDAELLRGVSHVENRSVAQQIADNMPEPTPRFNSDESSPYAKALAMGLGEPNRKETKQEMYERLDREWQTKNTAKAEQEAFNADPKRQKAVEHAKRERDALKFDPTATAQEVEEADSRLALAVNGDLGDYGKADRAWRATKQAKIDAETATVDAQIQALRQRRREIETKHFDPPAPPPAPMPEPIATPVVRMTQAELDEMMRPTREATAIRAEQAKYPAR
jgi:hypothetical protein